MCSIVATYMYAGRESAADSAEIKGLFPFSCQLSTLVVGWKTLGVELQLEPLHPWTFTGVLNKNYLDKKTEREGKER